MNLENEGTCVQQHILDVMFRILSNLSKSSLTVRLFGGLKKINKL